MTAFRPALTLRPEDVRCIASLQRPGHAGRRIAGLVPELLELVAAEALIRPAFIHETRKVAAVVAGMILLQGGTALHAPLLARKLPGVQHLAIGLCTIGAVLGHRVNDLFARRRGLEALVLDEIGNAAVRKLARRAHARIRADAKRLGLQASSALSPGARGFDIDQQARLCDLAGAARIGVTVQGGTMMHPGKSASFVIGLGDAMPRWRQAEDCRDCRAAARCRNRVTA